MMTKRSNHMPMFTRIEAMNIHGMLVRALLNQNAWGTSTLHVIIDQYAHQYGPNARLMKQYRS
jgi:hypothetical protein